MFFAKLKQRDGKIPYKTATAQACFELNSQRQNAHAFPVRKNKK
jgi:hypothetical protein